MKLNVFLIVAAIVVAVFGVGLLLFPNRWRRSTARR
jgi:uncharacterized protein YjeT (DUF2065 family)